MMTRLRLFQTALSLAAATGMFLQVGRAGAQTAPSALPPPAAVVPSMPVVPMVPPPPSCAGVPGAIGEAASAPPFDAELVRSFYQIHGPSCAWDERNAAALLAVLDAAAEEGLEPSLFGPDELSVLPAQPSPAQLALRDVKLTDAALRYAVVISHGLSWTGLPDPNQPADYRSHRDVVAGMIEALKANTVAPWLKSLSPQHDTYQRLKSALGTYRRIASEGGWDTLPANLAGKPRRTRQYAQLRHRLFVEGDLATDSRLEDFDDELRLAIARFQQRNGLRDDGIPDSKTISRLNVTAGERVALISLNLERLRVALRDLPATRVDVNVPAATAILYREGRPFLSMNAVVGAPKHETPELSSLIDTIVLNPTWTIPTSIIQNEIRPLLKRNKRYLKQNRMYWSGDQLIQEPGPLNALGQVKFDFPNPYAVYLHDTPARRLFTDPERAASHGCVRLQHPLDLAAELLSGDASWTRDGLEAAIRSGRTQRIRLQDPMPVVISYQTAFVDPEGRVQFRADIYGRDTALTLRLAERANQLVAAPVGW